jgi:hypothetical protein
VYIYIPPLWKTWNLWVWLPTVPVLARVCRPPPVTAGGLRDSERAPTVDAKLMIARSQEE